MSQARPPAAFEAYFSRSRLLVMLPLGVAFVYLGLVLADVFAAPWPRAQDSYVIRLFGWISALFFGWITFGIAKRVVTGGLAFRIDAVGIYDPKRSPNIIPWSAIEDVRIIRIPPNRMLANRILGYDLADNLVDRLPLLQQIMVALNRRCSGISAGIATAGTDRSFQEVIEAVREFAPDKLKLLPGGG